MCESTSDLTNNYFFTPVNTCHIKRDIKENEKRYKHRKIAIMMLCAIILLMYKLLLYIYFPLFLFPLRLIGFYFSTRDRMNSTINFPFLFLSLILFSYFLKGIYYYRFLFSLNLLLTFLSYIQYRNQKHKEQTFPGKFCHSILY